MAVCRGDRAALLSARLQLHLHDRDVHPILSDFNKEVAREYGVLHDEVLGLKGVAKRSAFVIGSDGRVAYDWVSEDPRREPSYEEIAQAVKRAA